jgi:hypothetical protein
VPNEPVEYAPTATQLVELVQDTSPRPPVPELGLGVTDHLVPFHDPVRVAGRRTAYWARSPLPYTAARDTRHAQELIAARPAVRTGHDGPTRPVPGLDQPPSNVRCC